MKSSDESSSCASSTSGPIVNFANPSKCYRQIKENEREQQSLNLDVILSGFPEKPDCKTVVDLFLNRHQMSSEQVQASFQFENRSYYTFYHIVITFEDRTSKSQLFSANKKLSRPIRWNQVSGRNHTYNNPIISFNNRFSKFNLLVERQLKRLKHSATIAQYKFNTVFYCYKQTPASEWQEVSVVEDIDDLVDLLKYVKLR